MVIVGILMAISIDSWWTAIGNRGAEQDLLISLSSEFDRNQASLDAQFEGAYDRRRAAAEALLRLGPAATDLTSDSLTSLWRWVTRGGTYDPSTGVLSAATTSGEVTLLRDPTLRAALAEWPARIANIANVEGIVNDLLFVQFVPWLRLQTALPDASFGEFGIPAARHTTDFAFLSSSLVVENFLREIVAWGRVLDDNRSELQETIDSIRAGIERSLDDE